jgi:ATP-binding cassette subfamily B protein
VNLAKYQTLWALTRGQRARYGAAILAMGLSNLFLFGVPLVSKTVIDFLLGEAPNPDGIAGRMLLALAGNTTPFRVLATAAAAGFTLTALGGGLLYLRGRWAAIASEAIVRGIRDRVLGHLQHLPCSFHDRAETGDLVQRCTSDVETIRVFLAGQVVEIGRALLLLLTVLPILIALDVRMTVVSLALFPVIIAFAILFFRRVQRLFRATDEAEGKMTAVLQENLTGIRVVRAFARQEFECARFAERNREFRDRNHALIRLLGNYWALSDLLCVGQIGLLLVYGAIAVQRAEITVGTLFAFLLYENLVIWPVRHMGRLLTDTGKALVALDRLREILSTPEETDPPVVPEGDAPRLRGEIEVEGLTFGFGETEPVLRNVSFRVERGQTLALVGPPGAGKSTLIQLLLRLYDYEEGSIRLDGRELSTLGRKQVRAQIGVVLQEPFLYSKTLSANVRVGRPEASHEEIVESASAASVHEAIEEFEQGYETLVGERGVTLSGGQRQRVALARALLKDPPILVLDDALSAVDTQTEAGILDALRRRQGRHTTLLIAHRLSSIRHADRILVLEEGRIVQSGSHEELTRAEGPYRRLWQIQGTLEEEIEEDLGLRTGEETR